MFEIGIINFGDLTGNDNGHYWKLYGTNVPVVTKVTVLTKEANNL